MSRRADDRDAEDRQARRARPPAGVLRWLLDELDASEITGLEAMPGGSTSAMHRVTIRHRGGSERAVVLRRYVLEHVLAETPDVAVREWTALQLAADASVPTPTPIAADLEAERVDAPTVVMSSLDGRPVWEGRQPWLDQMVDAMIDINQIALPMGAAVPPIERYEQAIYEPPLWSTRPGVWERAFEIFHAPIPDLDVGFVHRDFHPGNTLWRSGRLTGVVDWQSACWGPASIDPGHCRMNLLLSSPDLAERLLVTWERQTERSYHPWADVFSIVGILDSHRPNRSASKALRSTEDALARAVADLTG